MMAGKKKEVFFDFPRPVDSAGLVGHAAARNDFLDAWEKRDAHPIHPVWLLTGPRGIGKATLAYSLARRVFSDLTGKPEDEIAGQMSVGGMGDLHIADMEHNITKDNRPAKSITIETVRGMIGKLQMSSMGESWRVVIIDSIDELSDKTPNALLKTLEEPPAKTVFFVIAHSLDNVLPTIRSRSRVEKLSPLSPMELREIGGALLPERELTDELIKISGGSFGRIANLVATGADNLFDDAKRIMTDKTANSADCLALAKRIAANQENLMILADLTAFFGLSELYSAAIRDIRKTSALNLDPEIAAFKILTEIKKCL